MKNAQTEPWSASTRHAPEPLELDATGTIGKYRLEGVLGRGGEGVVLAARDTELGRAVAIKFRVRDTEDAHERLLREAQAMAQLSHPNVVTVYEVLRLGDRTGIVMALIDGCDLQRWRESPRTWREIVGVYLQAARGLAAAHRVGLVHRDFKPSNAMVDAEGVVRVSDFGLARATGDRELHTATTAAPASDHRELTRMGTIVGTPAYFAPEQRTGARVDARSDQFSFAVALYEALAGRRPFADTSAALRRPVPPPGPAWLRRVVMRALAIDPAARLPSMTEVVVALERGLRRRRALAGVAAATVCATMFAIMFWRSTPTVAPPTWNPVEIGNEPGDSAIRAIAISRDGAMLAYASDTDIAVEPRLGGARVHVAIPAAIGPPESVKLSRTGDRVLVGAHRPDGTVEIWETTLAGTWRRRVIPTSVSSGEWDVAGDDGLIVIEGRDDGRLARVDVSGNEHVIASAGPHSRYLHPVFSFDGARIAVERMTDDTMATHIELIDLATRHVEQVSTLECLGLDWLGPESLVCSAHDRSGGYLVELSVSNDAGASQPQTRYTIPPYANVWQLQASEAGLLFSEEAQESHVHLVELPGGQRQKLSTGSVIDAAAAGWTTSGKLIFGANIRGRMQMLALDRNGTIDVLPSTPDVSETPLAVVGESIIFGRFPGRDQRIPLTNLAIGRFYGDGDLFRREPDGVVTALGPTRNLIALRCAGDRAPPCVLVESPDRKLVSAILWDPTTGARGREVSRGPLSTMRFHALGPDGQTLAGVASGHEVELVNLRDGTTKHVGVEGYRIRFVSWQPDGDLIAAAREIATNRWFVLQLTPEHSTPIFSAGRGEFLTEPRISPDGKRMAIGINDQHRKHLWFAHQD